MHQKPSFFSKYFMSMPKMGEAEQQQIYFKCQYPKLLQNEV